MVIVCSAADREEMVNAACTRDEVVVEMVIVYSCTEEERVSIGGHDAVPVVRIADDTKEVSTVCVDGAVLFLVHTCSPKIESSK